jgi:MFS family permease
MDSYFFFFFLNTDGRLSDAFGRKSTLQFCVIVFFIGSLMCGLSDDLVTLVISRTIAGIGGGGLNTVLSNPASLRTRLTSSPVFFM